MAQSSSAIISAEHPPETKASHKFLRIARRFFPAVITFRRYIEALNAQIQDPSPKIHLQEGDICSSSFHRLLDRLYIAWPSKLEFPRDAQQGLKTRGSVSIDQLLQDVIITTLRRYPTGYAAEHRNVLCNGFSIASNHGHASVLRDLDARASSTPVQLLRSPIWKQILKCVGHDVLHHLLMKSVLLLSISETATLDNFEDASKVSKCTSSVFLQLCGPSLKECVASRATSISKSPSTIVLKRDLMYCTPTNRRVPVDATNKDGVHASSRDAVELRNGGLPKSHHLQGLTNDEYSAKKLLSIVFQLNCGSETESEGDNPYNSFSNSSVNNKTFTAALKAQKFYTGTNFDQRARHPSISSWWSRRGRTWLKARNPSYKRLSRLVPMLQRVIRRTHQLSLRRVLGMTCPLPKAFDRTRDSTQFSCEELIKMSSCPKDVARFVIACIRQMLPIAVFGSSRNRDVFEKGVHSFLRRRLMRESFDIFQFSSQNGIAVKDVEWLHRPGKNGMRICNPTDLKFRRSRINDLCVWLFRGLVLPIIQQSFYVTDGDLYRNRIFFFRREVWVLLIDRTLDNVLRANKKFKVLSKEDLAKCTAKRERNLTLLGKNICPYPVFLYHQLRFVPKRSSLRGIQRMRGKLFSGFSKLGKKSNAERRRSSSDIVKAKYCMRRIFRCILRVLAMESDSNRSKLGASVFSLNDVYERFLPLKTRWRQQGRPQMYICSVDISASFDTVPLGTLLSDILPDLLSRDRYVLFRYAVSKPSLATRGAGQRFLAYACREPGEETSFPRVVREHLCPQHAGAIFTDLVQTTILTRAQVILAIRELLGENVVSIPRRKRCGPGTGFARQCHGLPQGNELSTLLTSLFYGHVENEDLSQFLRPQGSAGAQSNRITLRENEGCGEEISLLMRQVDDTIFLTSECAKAIKFVKRAAKGWDNTHGFSVNVCKTKSNFASSLVSAQQMRRLAWCGLIIDTQTLEITADYNRYGRLESGRLRDTLCIEQDSRPGQFFAERSWTCFKPKLHPLLLDSCINSRFTAALNVYQAAFLASLKLSSYAVVLLPRADHLANVTETVSTKFVDLVLRVVSSRWARNRFCHFSLSHGEVKFLTIHAFRRTIVRKLRPRRKMKRRVTQCLNMIQKKLKDTKDSLRTHELSIELLAKRIVETSCGALCSIRL